MKIGSFEGTLEEYNAFVAAQPEMAEKSSLVVSGTKTKNAKKSGKSVHTLLKNGVDVAVSLVGNVVKLTAVGINKTEYALEGGREAYKAYLEGRMEGQYGIKYFTASNKEGWSDLFVARCLEEPELAEALKA